MKKISLLILIVSLIGCNSDKKASEIKTEPKKLNTELIGIYEYKALKQSENHYLVIDTLNGKYSALYYGAEDNSRFGILFYKNEIKKLTIENNTISFEIGKRELCENSLMKVVKQERNLEKKSIIAISRGLLKYNGELLKDSVKLKCQSDYGDCWDSEMTFEKLTDKK